MPREQGRSALLVVMVLTGLAGGVAWVALGGDGPPNDPVPVLWDKQACAHCRMAVGQPGTAAELITKSGDVLVFDDPGCLLRYLEERHPAVHRLWFHHRSEDRWLSAAEAGFRRGAVTPMGWGLEVVERGPDTLDLEAAHAYVASRAGGSSARPSGADGREAGSP